jgi:hypothetical protein
MVKLVNQFTDTPTELPAVRAFAGKTSERTTHTIGARPILKERTNAITPMPESDCRCLLRPIARRIHDVAVPKLDIRRRRFEPTD